MITGPDFQINGLRRSLSLCVGIHLLVYLCCSLPALIDLMFSILILLLPRALTYSVTIRGGLGQASGHYILSTKAHITACSPPLLHQPHSGDTNHHYKWASARAILFASLLCRLHVSASSLLSLCASCSLSVCLSACVSVCLRGTRYKSQTT
jgi:hypothetical protein